MLQPVWSPAGRNTWSSFASKSGSCSINRRRFTGPTYRSDLPVIVQQREHIVPAEFLAPFQEVQFNHKRQSGNFRAQAAGELRRRGSGSAGGQQVVHDQDALALSDGIFVDFQLIAAILQVIADPRRFGAPTSPPCDRNEPPRRPGGHRPREAALAGPPA